MPDFTSNPPIITDLAGRLAVVTGGASGIGYAIARRLAQAGSKVLIIDIDQDKLEQAQRNFSDEGLGFTPVVGDLASRAAGRLADDLLADHGSIPLIVNNVGVCTGTGFYDTDEDRFDRVFATNLRGPWFFTRRLTEELVRRGEPGSALFISSLHDRFVIYRPQYSASKAAVSQLVRELASLLAPHGIRVNAISPGSIETAGSPERDGPRFRAEEVPLGRGLPDDVAKAALFLLSEAWSRYITGVNLPVDGGLALHTWHPLREPVLD
ncbi:MAG TPA: SDR family oxidoreductase [Actinomycetota bacterium]|jgi:NAD(P)-dependent dehydrogenase (short-subunit alcohol dehydrogenase family)|nr:SDR family oxidoreductase [Actinomycetota bacterium]